MYRHVDLQRNGAPILISDLIPDAFKVILNSWVCRDIVVKTDIFKQGFKPLFLSVWFSVTVNLFLLFRLRFGYG